MENGICFETEKLDLNWSLNEENQLKRKKNTKKIDFKSTVEKKKAKFFENGMEDGVFKIFTELILAKNVVQELFLKKYDGGS